ncbi:hypothetical protein DOTSEDRAFT_36476 [Dothistroma septosporum NZE10]|uniref:Uncharacterized protein n=1 Tax=Dothistroma septosporum (strain NZE10 / CBS 128990) TaxID=675120 RepID=N1PKM3_DOTSN|nr:hypothetical protein DOTSEDRAFT_36476 [Dothistroma septosporum NZE10]
MYPTAAQISAPRVETHQSMARDTAGTSRPAVDSEQQDITVVSTQTWTGPAANPALAARLNHDASTLKIHMHYQEGHPLELCMSSYRHDSQGLTCFNREKALTDAMGSSESSATLSQARLAKMLLPFFRFGDSSTYKFIDGDAYGLIAASIFASLVFEDVTEFRLKELVKSGGLVEHQITGFQLDNGSPLEQGSHEFGTVVLPTVKAEYPHLYPNLSEEGQEDFKAALESEDIDEILDYGNEIGYVYETYEQTSPPENKMQMRRDKVFKLKAKARAVTQQAQGAMEGTETAQVADQLAERHGESNTDAEHAKHAEYDELSPHNPQPATATEQDTAARPVEVKEETRTKEAPIREESILPKREYGALDSSLEDDRVSQRSREHEQIAPPAFNGEDDSAFDALNDISERLLSTNEHTSDLYEVKKAPDKKRPRNETDSDDTEHRAPPRKIKLDNNNAETKAVSGNALFDLPKESAGSPALNQNQIPKNVPKLIKRPTQAPNFIHWKNHTTISNRSIAAAETAVAVEQRTAGLGKNVAKGKQTVPFSAPNTAASDEPDDGELIVMEDEPPAQKTSKTLGKRKFGTPSKKRHKVNPKESKKDEEVPEARRVPKSTVHTPAPVQQNGVRRPQDCPIERDIMAAYDSEVTRIGRGWEAISVPRLRSYLDYYHGRVFAAKRVDRKYIVRVIEPSCKTKREQEDEAARTRQQRVQDARKAAHKESEAYKQAQGLKSAYDRNRRSSKDERCAKRADTDHDGERQRIAYDDNRPHSQQITQDHDRPWRSSALDTATIDNAYKLHIQHQAQAARRHH